MSLNVSYTHKEEFSGILEAASISKDIWVDYNVVNVVLITLLLH